MLHAIKETNKAHDCACVVMEGFSEEADIKAENYHAKRRNGVAHEGNSMCEDLKKEGNLEKHKSKS